MLSGLPGTQLLGNDNNGSMWNGILLGRRLGLALVWASTVHHVNLNPRSYAPLAFREIFK